MYVIYEPQVKVGSVVPLKPPSRFGYRLRGSRHHLYDGFPAGLRKDPHEVSEASS